MKNKNKNNRGFSLIEVIIGITMLLLTATAALSLSKTVIRTENFNENRVMAYNLAQEAMEETRRSRDSNWDDLKSDTRWENDSIELLSSENTTCTEDGTNLLCDIEGKKFTLTRTIKPVDNFTSLHDISDTIRGTDIDGNLVKRVYIKVGWQERGAQREIVLVTLLSDWKAY
jgi:prepilin-type N-terminal cleavage/methylation domain-containing protein